MTWRIAELWLAHQKKQPQKTKVYNSLITFINETGSRTEIFLT